MVTKNDFFVKGNCLKKQKMFYSGREILCYYVVVKSMDNVSASNEKTRLCSFIREAKTLEYRNGALQTNQNFINVDETLFYVDENSLTEIGGKIDGRFMGEDISIDIDFSDFTLVSIEEANICEHPSFDLKLKAMQKIV
jgi:hypothetical protein